MGRGSSSSSPSPSRARKEKKEKKQKKDKKEKKERDKGDKPDRDYGPGPGYREPEPRGYDRPDRGVREREVHGRRGPEYGRVDDRDYDRPRPRDRERDWERRDEYYREDPRDREREHDRDRTRDKEKERDGSKREKERERERDREHEDGVQRDAKRRRAGSEGAPNATAAPAQRDGLQAQAPAPAVSVSAEDLAQQRRDAEAAALEAQVERRRKAVEEWRRKKQVAEQGEQDAAAAAQQQEQQQAEAANGARAKGWSLEDDEEDDDEQQQGGSGDGTGACTEGGDVDADGDTAMQGGTAGSPQQQGAQADGGADKDAGAGDEVDPLDAFMAGAEPQAAVGKANPKAAGKGSPAAAGVLSEDAAAATGGATVGGLPLVKHEGGGAVQPVKRRRWAPVVSDTPSAPAAGTTGGDDDEIDPLDAFMAEAVLPEVSRAQAKAANRQRAASEAREATPTPMDEGGAGPQVKPDPDALPGPSSRLSPAPVAGPSSRGPRPGGAAAGLRKKPRGVIRRRASSDDESSGSDSDDDSAGGKEESEEDDAEWARLVTSGKLSKGDRLVAVDHSAINYVPFRKNFYIEVPELARMSEEERAALRKELDGIKVRGKNVPAPIRAWTQAGLSGRVLEVLRKGGMDRPLPIQAQSLPVIMSGRDCIGIAKTGSGKTLAFVLPMMRHVKDQPPLAQGDGPIALVIAPTRELVAQIAKEAKLFAKPLGINALAVFGGSGVANQITELKRGVEIVSCTPGRMIDLLVTSNGKITNLRRVTYLVMDEADRMFDMGFEPQITRIITNIRPDRQTVMFSATFPRQVEVLARKVLVEPVEIMVGGRSVVNTSITQYVEIRPEADRFLRLLEVLGEWYERGKIIIFVDKQEKCDNLFRDLLKYGYPCLSLHGGKDQSDRESTIADFKGAVCSILVATGVAARGLDVKELVLVVNYDVPNHHEEYVHRVGRTGRAGASGTAITFIGPDEERYAPDLVKALKESGAGVPQDLQVLADAFHDKLRAGQVKAHGSGYGGSGFKFSKDEDDDFRMARKAKVKAMGLEVEGEAEQEDDAVAAALAALDDDDNIKVVQAGQGGDKAGAAAGPAAAANPGDAMAAAVAAAQARLAEAQKAGLIPTTIAAPVAPGAGAGSGAPAAVGPAAAGAPAAAAAPAAPINPTVAIAQQIAAKLSAAAVAGVPASLALTTPTALQGIAMSLPVPAAQAAATAPAAPSELAARAAAIASRLSAGVMPPSATHKVPSQPLAPTGCQSELDINDFPQHARWKITHRDSLNNINELTGAAVTVRGSFVAPGKPLPEGERKLYLLIEGSNEQVVKRAKQEIKKILEETTEKVMRRDAPAGGRYSVM